MLLKAQPSRGLASDSRAPLPGERFLASSPIEGSARPCRAPKEAAREAQAAAWVGPGRPVWHFALLAVTVGLAAGAQSGTLAGLVIGRGLLGG